MEFGTGCEFKKSLGLIDRDFYLPHKYADGLNLYQFCSPLSNVVANVRTLEMTFLGLNFYSVIKCDLRQISKFHHLRNRNKCTNIPNLL